MKKRFLSYIALLLLLSLSLASCAEGLPGHELFVATKDAVADFSENMEMLFAGDVPLAQNGKTSYQLVVPDGSLKEEYMAALTFFENNFQSKTGAVLDHCRENADTPKIWLYASNAQRAELPTLDANTFYIGFVGEDLVLHAQNTPMLYSAISYFAKEILPLAKGGTLSLPRSFSYLSTATTCHKNEYIITRAENSSEKAIATISYLLDTLNEKAGVRFSIKSDFNTTGAGVKEILVGAPDRAECNAILAGLSHDDYYIGGVGQKLMILAKNDLMLELAVQKFIETFLNAENAVYDKSERMVQLPTSCDYFHNEASALLANEGKCTVALVHPRNASKKMLTQIQRFCALFQKLTNASLQVCTDEDYARDPNVFEILVGDTSRTESKKQMRALAEGEWAVAMPSEHALVVAAKEDDTLIAALQALGSYLTEMTAKISPQSIFYEHSYTVIPGVNRLLFLPYSLADEVYFTLPQPR
ncbi:MAG: hypothetical protein E7624_03335 [Ruminococcaceae bacterium]|nr:hypothetical protein [Oscillospiraceae bacterium]